MPVINVADVPINLVEQKPQGPRLNFMDSKGDIFYLPMMKDECMNSINIFDGTDVYSGAQKSMYLSVDSFDSCDDIVLPAGCWSVELQGGKGGDGGNASGSGGDGETQVYNFKLLQTTTVSVFRGSDGNKGTVNSSSNYYAGGGGGASGMPSMVKINDNVITASGGAGGMGGQAKSQNSTYSCAAGGGGNAGSNSNGLKAIASVGGNSCGGGGGGAWGSKTSTATTNSSSSVTVSSACSGGCSGATSVYIESFKKDNGETVLKKETTTTVANDQSPNNRFKYFIQKLLTTSDLDTAKGFGNNACGATSLLNEIAEQYTLENGCELTEAQAKKALLAAIEGGELRETDAFVRDWSKAANLMSGALGLKGKWTYTTKEEKATGIIYSIDTDKFDGDFDGMHDHFVNDIGNGLYYDPWDNEVGEVKNLQLTSKWKTENGIQSPYRYLEYECK